MNAGDLDQLRASVRNIVGLLVSGEYSELVRLSKGRRLSEHELRATVTDYGRELVPLPASAFDALDVVEVRDAKPPQYSVNVDLWTAEEGKSDLTLQLTLTQRSGGFDVEIDDIHVL